MEETPKAEYNFEETFGSFCFTEKRMRNRLPKSAYKELQQVRRGEIPLSLNTADVIATAMKDWALENGATHFCHWFHPLTGFTAEKHEAFIVAQDNGSVLSEFSGEELIVGEPDASSFPSGGLRTTFEARGYTAWDTSSPAFLKQNGKNSLVLSIPTVFVSYNGEALDKKAPLLRSMTALSRNAVRVLNAIGAREYQYVESTVGAEQEYFLIRKELYEKRLDLRLTGRTVIGSMPAKGQEMEDHYFGNIQNRAASFMSDLNQELWKLGVMVRTQHNEVAPNQFEIAPIFCTSNLATDQNQLTMEILKRVADRHGLACLLHEKPFEGVNGSGKHNNWSMVTDNGVNLLDPGKTREENRRFLLLVAGILKAVDKYADILRCTASSAGNDHRLGANEAPPPIISIFLGGQIETALEQFTGNSPDNLKNNNDMISVGSHLVPSLPKDQTDRNRTSPFAFTGNKFEFRMLGSSMSIADCNIVLNTAMAEVLSEFADQLENTDQVDECIASLIRQTYSAHKRIIFNSNGYSQEWEQEAQSRGLPNLKNTLKALPSITSPHVVELFTKHRIFTESELRSRYEIRLETYIKTLHIEALILEEMVNTGVIPTITQQINQLSKAVLRQEQLGLTADRQKNRLSKLNLLLEGTIESLTKLDEIRLESKKIEDMEQVGELIEAELIPQMWKLREFVDTLEHLSERNAWPFPSYSEMLFSL